MLFPDRLFTRFRGWAEEPDSLSVAVVNENIIYLGNLFSRSSLCYITHFLFAPVFVKLKMVYNFDRSANASAWRNKQPRKPTMSMTWRFVF